MACASYRINTNAFSFTIHKIAFNGMDIGSGYIVVIMDSVIKWTNSL